MPSIRPGYLAETPVREPVFGIRQSPHAALRELYPTHPLFNEMNDDAIRRSFFTPPETTGARGARVMNDGGYMFGLVNMDYQGTPDFTRGYQTGGKGLPASPYGPNIAAPSNGHDPASIPMEGTAEATLEVVSRSRGAFNGSSLVSPHQTIFIAGPPGTTLAPGNGSGGTFVARVF